VAMAAEESGTVRVSVKEQNAMVHWGGDREVTHAQVCARCSSKVGGMRRRPRLGLTGLQHSSAQVVRRSGGKTAEMAQQHRHQVTSSSDGVEAGCSSAHARGEKRGG
jgi:hypothetical protein